MSGLEGAEHRATRDGGAGDHRRRHRFVGRPQPVGVLDGHDPATGEPPREHDHTQAGGEHCGAGDGRQVGSPMPSAVPVRGLLERSDHGRDGKAEGRGVAATRDGRPVGDPRRRAFLERGAGRAPLPCRGRRRRRRRRRPEGEHRQHAEQHHADHRPRGPVSRVPPAGRPCRLPRSHACTVARGGGSGTPREPGCGWTDPDVDNRPGTRTPGGRATGPGVCWSMHLAHRGDFARPRTPSTSGSCRTGGTVPGRSRGSRPVDGVSTDRERWVRAPARRQGGAADRRAATTVSAVRQGRAGSRGEHRPWPSSP
jgi:hypothetical protein